eukprot:1144853-Pelagomonas_calceolata.AAC.12
MPHHSLTKTNQCCCNAAATQGTAKFPSQGASANIFVKRHHTNLYVLHKSMCMCLPLPPPHTHTHAHVRTLLAGSHICRQIPSSGAAYDLNKSKRNVCLQCILFAKYNPLPFLAA